jgi:hypothetical protein
MDRCWTTSETISDAAVGRRKVVALGLFLVRSNISLDLFAKLAIRIAIQEMLTNDMLVANWQGSAKPQCERF